MLSLILINSVFNYQVLDQLQIKRPAFLRNCLLNLRYHYVAVGIVFLHWNSQSPIEWFFPQKMHWYFPNMESFESTFSISVFFFKNVPFCLHKIWQRFNFVFWTYFCWHSWFPKAVFCERRSFFNHSFLKLCVSYDDIILR